MKTKINKLKSTFKKNKTILTVISVSLLIIGVGGLVNSFDNSESTLKQSKNELLRLQNLQIGIFEENKNLETQIVNNNEIKYIVEHKIRCYRQKLIGDENINCEKDYMNYPK